MIALPNGRLILLVAPLLMSLVSEVAAVTGFYLRYIFSAKRKEA